MFELLFIIGLLLLILPFIIIFGIFLYLKKKYNYNKAKKISKILCIIVSSFYFVFFIFSVAGDAFFFNYNARQLLAEQDIILNDDFNILENHSYSDFANYEHYFRLKISKKDKNNLINEIKNSKNFKYLVNGNSELDNWLDSVVRHKGTEINRNIETYKYYLREIYKPIPNSMPIHRSIYIYKEDNILIFEENTNISKSP